MDNPLPWVRTVLATTPNRWLELTQSLPPELLRLSPAPGEWSAVACLQHMIDVEQIFRFRLQAFLEGRDFPAFDPDSQGTRPDEQQSPAAAAQTFAEMRAQSLEVLESITAADLERRAHHAELGPVTLSEMIHEWAAHDLNHTIQAEEALMQPFIRGCGPWQRYFTSHSR